MYLSTWGKTSKVEKHLELRMAPHFLMSSVRGFLAGKSLFGWQVDCLNIVLQRICSSYILSRYFHYTGQTLSADTLLDVIVEDTASECEKSATCSLNTDEQEHKDLLSRDAVCASHQNDVTATWSDDSSCDRYSRAVATGSVQDSPTNLMNNDTLDENLDSSQHQKSEYRLPLEITFINTSAYMS